MASRLVSTPIPTLTILPTTLIFVPAVGAEPPPGTGNGTLAITPFDRTTTEPSRIPFVPQLVNGMEKNVLLEMLPVESKSAIAVGVVVVGPSNVKLLAVILFVTFPQFAKLVWLALTLPRDVSLTKSPVVVFVSTISVGPAVVVVFVMPLEAVTFPLLATPVEDNAPTPNADPVENPDGLLCKAFEELFNVLVIASNEAPTVVSVMVFVPPKLVRLDVTLPESDKLTAFKLAKFVASNPFPSR